MSSITSIPPQTNQKLNKPKTVSQRTRFFQFYLIVATLAFVYLAILVKKHPYFPSDQNIALFIQNLHLPLLKEIMLAISWPGYFPQSVLIASGIILALLLFKAYIEAGITAISYIGMEILVSIIKTGIGRIRPIQNVFTGNSFPSGHVVDYFVVCGFLLYLTYSHLKNSWVRKFFITLFLVIIIGVGLSRIYLKAHWPSDILGAYILASIWLILTIAFYKKLLPIIQAWQTGQ